MKIAIITAMPTEVWPLIKSWPRRTQPHHGRKFRFYESPEAVVLPGGIGHAPGKRAAEAIIALYRPELVIAAGLAGGLKPQWALGQILIASEVIDSGTGQHFAALDGSGIVVSSRIIAGVAEKRRLAAAYPEADVVDMEGAAVAEVAAGHGLPFMAVKAVSDNLEFDLPPLNPFVDAEGRFQTLRFTIWAAVRPQWWPKIAHLKRISDTGAQALAELLKTIISSKVAASRDMISSSTTKPALTRDGD